MRRGKARAYRAILYQKSHMVCNGRIMARPQAKKSFFYQCAAYKVAYYGIYYNEKEPEPAMFFKINSGKQDYKKIKRQPEIRFPCKGEDGVKKRIMPLPVYFRK